VCDEVDKRLARCEVVAQVFEAWRPPFGVGCGADSNHGLEVVVGIDARDHEAWNGFTGHAGLLREVGANVSWCAAFRCRASWSWHHLSVEEPTLSIAAEEPASRLSRC
jgi:hypothetical protein